MRIGIMTHWWCQENYGQQLQAFALQRILKDRGHQPYCKNYGSDLTLADFWGVERILPDFNDEKGVSLVFVNSGHGKKALDTTAASCLDVKAIEYDDLSKLCSMFTLSVQPHRNRAAFFKDFLAGHYSVKELVDRYATKTFRQKSVSALHQCAHKLGVVHFVRKMRGSCR